MPLLSDFGIARALDAPELTSAGRTVGTPAYMAPEQCAGSREVDGRADIYSLGAVLYRCITGRMPFSGSTTQILHAHVYDPLVIEDSVLRLLPPVMVEILQRSMAKRPDDRYPTADALADALDLGGRAHAAGKQHVRAEGSTATLTLSSLPATPPPAPITPSATVLVPGLSDAITPPAGQPSVYRPPQYAGAGYETPYQPTPRTNPLVRPATGAPRQDPAVTMVSPTQEYDADEDEAAGGWSA